MSETELLDRIEALTAERDYWKTEARGVRSTTDEGKLADRFALTPAEAWLLAVLYELGPDRVLLFSRIADEMPGHGNTRINNTGHVIAHRLRRKVSPDAFVTIRSRGYSITNKGLDLCRNAINDSTFG